MAEEESNVMRAPMQTGRDLHIFESSQEDQEAGEGALKGNGSEPEVHPMEKCYTTGELQV